MATQLAPAPIGHNSPPPIESHRLHIEELMEAAQQYLDGEPITSQAQADDVGKLLGQLRQAHKGADEQRAKEKKPHDDAAKAVQAVWKPLLDRVDTAERVAKKALEPFLEAEGAKQRAAAEAARKEADDKAAAARAAAQAAQATDLAARVAVEALRKDADKAAKAANRAEKDKPMAAGTGRSVSLRSVWRAEVTDPIELGRHLWKTRRAEYEEMLLGIAQREVNAGVRSLPGCSIIETRKAV